MNFELIFMFPKLNHQMKGSIVMESKVCLVKVKIEQLEACKGGEMTEVVASFKALNEVYEQLTLQLVVGSQAINEE